MRLSAILTVAFSIWVISILETLGIEYSGYVFGVEVLLSDLWGWFRGNGWWEAEFHR